MKTSIVVAFLVLVICSSARGQTLEWIRQFDTSTNTDDLSSGVSADRLGNVFVSGTTGGSLEGPNAGGLDAFVSKYDTGGTLEWTRQLGTSGMDDGYGVSADGLGNAYVSGRFDGNSLGGTSDDAFLSKYSATGTLEWTQLLGTSSPEASRGVSADGLGNVYISGWTEGSLEGSNAGSNDAFLSKYDEHGTLQWTRQLGTGSKDESVGVSADGLGSVYISGFSGRLGGNAGGSDAFLSKYDADGRFQWTRSLGTRGPDWSNSVSADGLGNVYMSGSTSGSLRGEPFAGGLSDAFLSKYDEHGTLQWIQQLGTSSNEWSNAVTADRLGSVYISGYTEGDLGGPNAGNWDAFLSKYDADGTLQWTQQLGTTSYDSSLGISADGLGSVYISGFTEGVLGDSSAGGRDAFVAKFTNMRASVADFDGDGDLDIDDVDLLGKEIIAGTNNSDFDLTNDGLVNLLDQDQWRADAAEENGWAEPYLPGDANLDGRVTALDLNALAGNWNGTPDPWSDGDFNADGNVDAQDLNSLALNWQKSIAAAASLESVPEPAVSILLLSSVLATPLLTHRPRRSAFSFGNNKMYVCISNRKVEGSQTVVQCRPHAPS